MPPKLVHVNGSVNLPDTEAAMRLWGICTECGLSGVAREELPAVFNLHSSILEKFGAPQC